MTHELESGKITLSDNLKEVLCFLASNLTAWKRAPISSFDDKPEPILSYEQRLSILGWCNYVVENTDPELA